MISRVTEATLLIQVMNDTPALKEVNVDMNDWISCDTNVALEDNGSFGVFEFLYPGVYTGHYFFKARGKEAKAIANKMLHEMFYKYGAKVIRGLTPIEHKGALWMNRQLGFKRYEMVDTSAGPHYIFILTKEDFKS